MTQGTDLKSIGQILVPIGDVDRAVEFYEGVLGLPVLMRFPGIAFMDVAGIRPDGNQVGISREVPKGLDRG